MNNFYSVTFASVLVFAQLICAQAQTAAPPNSESVEEAAPKLTIESVKMDANLQENLVVFLEKVVAIDDVYTLNCDKLTVFLGGEERDPQKILAEGSVKIVQENMVSQSDRATIFPQEDKVILEGNARVRQGGNLFTGKSIEYTRSTGRVVMREGVRVSISDLRSLQSPSGTGNKNGQQTPNTPRSQ